MVRGVAAGTPVPPGGDERVLEALLDLAGGATGRRVAEAAGVSPTTAAVALARLEARGAVTRERDGRAFRWAAEEESVDVRSVRRARQRVLQRTVAQPGGSAAPDADRWEPTPPASARPVASALVFTALGLEYQQVAQHLRLTGRDKTRTGTRFAVGDVAGERLDWEVRLAEIGAGNTGAAAEVAVAVERFHPQLVLFVGIAGGLKPKDQQLGDVVVADRVYNVHSGKHGRGPDGEPTLLGRPMSLPTSHRVGQLAREVARGAWQPEAEGSDRPPQAHLKAIVAAEAVLADDGGELRQRIATHYNDAAAIEMEAYGTYEAARNAEVPVLAIRGLSDFAGADKQPEADRVHQPQAAANAAAFAVALLRHADPDDFPGGGGGAGSPPDPAPAAGTERWLSALPPMVQPWWRRLRAVAPALGEEALPDLAAHAAAPTGWLGRLRHRPPRWLRQDPAGDGWAMVAAFADGHQSPHASYAYDRAASAAAATGEDAAAAVHRLMGAMSAARRSPAGEEPGTETPTDGHPTEGADEARQRLLAEDESPVRPLAAFLLAALGDDAETTWAAAPPALHALQLDPPLVLPDERETGRRDAEPARAALEELEERCPGVLDGLRAQVLSILVMLYLVRDDTERAVRTADYAYAAVPTSSSLLLLGARARLQAVAGTGAARADGTDETSPAVLAEIEQTALLVRDRRRDWHGPTGDALALAGRARVQAHDFAGALRLLLPAPRGGASDVEARDPDVREVAALAATMAGETTLAAELARAVRDPVQRHLLRGMALAHEPSMADEAERSYRAALEVARDERPDQLVRALLGLVRAGASLDLDAPGSVAPDLERLRQLDAEAADLVQATAALTSGRPRDALVVARRYPQSAAAVQLAAEAAAASGDAAEAVRVLERGGRNKDDTSMLVQAMVVAVEASLDEDAERLADLLAATGDTRTRAGALRTKIKLAGRAGRWHEVAELCRRLLAEAGDADGDHSAHHLASYRWALVDAEYHLRRFDRALAALDKPQPLHPRNRHEALLQLAVLRAAERVDPLLAISRALATAEDWLEDEEVVAAALTLALTASPHLELPDPLLIELRRLQEAYFTRHAETASIRRLDVGEDLEGLVSYLEKTFAPGAEEFRAMAQRVWLGDYPRAILADATRRSYAELLIKGGAGCVVIAGDGREERRRAAARDALAAGVVVIDTSAVHLLGWIGLPSSRLTAEFARVAFPASLRDDVLSARAALALPSSGSLGWDPERRRPVLTEFSAELTTAWSTDANALARRARELQVVPDPPAADRHLLSRSLTLAGSMQAAAWMDDLALTYAAESTGVPAFGTLDLLHVLVERCSVTQAEAEDALVALMGCGAVDLPVLDRLKDLARAQEWEPTGYPALLLTRPRSWSDPASGFDRYRDLVEALPRDRRPDVVPGWAEAAATGLAWASSPGTRVRVVGAMLAWTAVQSDAALLPALADVARRVQDEAARDGDVFGQMMDVIFELITEIVGPAQTGAVVTRLVAPLDPERRTEAMRRFLAQRPPSAFGGGQL